MAISIVQPFGLFDTIYAVPRWEAQLAATRVLVLPIEEVSAKIRTGGPIDDEGDLGLAVWAGHVPIGLRAEAPVVADGVSPDLAPPRVRCGT